MTTMTSVIPLLAAAVSAAAVPLIMASGRMANLREGWTFAAALLKFALIVSMLPMVLAGVQPEYTIAGAVPEAGLALRVDPAGLLFALVSSSLWIITSIYSIGYMRSLREHAQTRYFSFFALSLSATVGVAFAANLLTMYLFYEMLSLSTYPLVTHHQDEEARSAGRKYLFYILGASIGMVLPAMIYLAVHAGTLEFSARLPLAAGVDRTTALVLLLLLVFGFAKSALMPFHSWLPAAMVAPTPVSALLHAVAVVKVGAFCVFRVITGVFGRELMTAYNFSLLLCAIAAATILVSSLIALSQDDLKRRLAFSTIGQLSYIILGVALVSGSGAVGGILHIAMHAFGKITLFFCAGAIFAATGVRSISGMAGIGRRMPLTMSAFFIGSLSVIGLPPCGGFVSKWFLAIGTIESGQYVMLAVLLASSLLNGAYFLPIAYRAFFTAPSAELYSGLVQEAPLWCLVPPVITALLSLALFFYPQPFLRLARMAAAGFTGG